MTLSRVLLLSAALPLVQLSTLGTADAALLDGERVVVIEPSELRSDPQDDEAVGTRNPGSIGELIQGPIIADGENWWKVDYVAGPDGWSPEDALEEAYFPASELSSDWRTLVSRGKTPSAADQGEILNETGVDWSTLQSAWNYTRNFSSDSRLLVIKDGYVVGEWGSNAPFIVASVTKSITGTTIASLFDAADRGELDQDFGPNDPLADFLPPEFLSADPDKSSIDVIHALTMSSGIEPDDAPIQPSYIDLALQQPVVADPGEQWSYSSLNPELLSVVATTVDGRSLREIFNEEIAQPIGMTPITWPSQDGYTRGSVSAEFQPRDLARIGYLLMMDGTWDQGAGQTQILSEERARDLHTVPSFVRASTFAETSNSPFMVESDANEYFGQLWWTNRTGEALGDDVPRDAFYAHGFFETLLVVVPSENLVVVRFGRGVDVDTSFRRELMSRVMDAIERPAFSPDASSPEPEPTPVVVDDDEEPAPAEPDAEMAVASLRLMDADTGAAISGFSDLQDGAELDLSELPKKLAVEAIVEGESIESVLFEIEHTFEKKNKVKTKTKTKKDKKPPYSMAGGGKKLKRFKFKEGEYVIEATPFEDRKAKGEAGDGVTISLTVID